MTELKRLEAETTISISVPTVPHLPSKSHAFDFDTARVHPSSDEGTAIPYTYRSKSWPSQPQVLRQRTGSYYCGDSIIDFVMLLIPWPFFILAFMVVVVNGKQVVDGDLRFLNGAIKWATTIFPIAFAAVAGRCTVKYATWKLERGTTIGNLEQLMGSRSVASAIATQVQLRCFNLVGLGLLALWCLSPLGGQSILHILFIPSKVVGGPVEISYLNSRQQSYSMPAGAFQYQWFSGFSTLFTTSLLAPSSVKGGGMDLWGNVKVPYYRRLIGRPSPDGWIDIASDDASSVIYSSLFGIPISNVALGNTSLRMESTYIELECGSLTTSDFFSQDNITDHKLDMISTNGPYFSYRNATTETPFALGYRGPDVGSLSVPAGTNSAFVFPQFCPDCLPPDLDTSRIEPGTLLFQEYQGVINITTISCTPKQVYVESQILCQKPSAKQAASCRVTSQRPSLVPHASPAVTYLSFPQVVAGLTELLPNTTAQGSGGNQIQNYYWSGHNTNLNAQSSATQNEGDATPLQGVSMPEFEDRWAQLLNTFLLGSIWNFTAYAMGAPFIGLMDTTPTGGHAASFIAVDADAHEEVAALLSNQTSAITVRSAQTMHIPIYAAFGPWLFVFLLCTATMQALAVAGMWFRRHTLLPEYLGYVSSLARESPWINMPAAGVHKDAIDQARLVRDVRVRLGDVGGNADGVGRENEKVESEIQSRGKWDGDGEEREWEKAKVGLLAFAREEETRRVEKGRWYV